jgi:hypothetical protein
MRFLPLVGLAVAALVTGCGSSSPSIPTIGAARTFHLGDFRPPGAVRPGRPTLVSFKIVQPSGATLTTYRRGAGPHTGIHLIFVRDDLSRIIHLHPPVASDGTLDEHVTFPSPGRYRLVVDAYPRLPGRQPNFQLFRWITVSGSRRPAALPPFRRTTAVDGFRFSLQGNPHLRALQPAFLRMTVTDPGGRPARFTPWFGALAHAIFFHAGSLDYFHTHVCSPGASGCTSVLGGSRVTGRSATPGRLDVGVLLPEPGTWRLFLQARVRRRVLTAPFTLRVR